MAERVTWTNEKRRLGDLLPWPRNPRTIKNAQAERLVDSVETFGQVETLAIGPGNEIYNGHQRLSVLRGQYGAEYEVDVRVASRALSEKEREKLTIYLHKGAAGEWDFDTLVNEFELDDLLAWGFDDAGAIADAVASAQIGDAEPGEGDRNMGEKSKQIKPVLYVDEVEDFERAIAMTGIKNRGDAVLFVCRFFLEKHETEG